jgi:hypothetical protein
MTNYAIVEAVKLLVSTSGRTSNKLNPTIGLFRTIPRTRSVVSSKVSPPGLGKSTPGAMAVSNAWVSIVI